MDTFINLPFYVGKGKGNRCKLHLIHEDKSNMLKQRKINEIRIMGKEPEILIIESNLLEKNAFDIEKKEIKKYGRKNNKTGILCNLTDGGEGSSGRFHTEFTKKIISEKRKNRVWNFKHSDKHKQKLTVNNPGGIKTSNPIYQFDLNGNFLTEWNSCSKASLKGLNVSRSIGSNNISRAAKNLYSYNNFIWIYPNDNRIIIDGNKIVNLELIKIRDGVKKLKQKDIEGNIIKIWDSIKEVCITFNIKPSMISWSNKNKKQHKGYYWEIYE